MAGNYLVFFDVDGTLINIKSMFSFLQYYWRNVAEENSTMPNFRYYRYLSQIFFAKLLGRSRTVINKKFYENFKNVETEAVIAAGQKWWRQISEDKKIYNHRVMQELKFHQKNGAEVVLVSGSMPACIEPLAEEIGVQHCLLTSLEVSNGQYTGRINGETNIGQGKKIGIMNFLSSDYPCMDLKRCFAYGDHSSDLPMLEIVGNPVVVGNDKLLLALAMKSGWRIIN